MKMFIGMSAKCETEEERQHLKEIGSNPRFGRWWCYWFPYIDLSGVSTYKYQYRFYWLCFWLEIYENHSTEYLIEKFKI